MATVKAFALPHGVSPSTSEYCGTRESKENDIPPVEHVGEAVHEAVQKAWRDGFDPAVGPFVVLVTFS